MTDQNNGGPAFPRSESLYPDGTVSDDGALGMTLRQYAAIKLGVPDSGVDWLDVMILKAKRDELAARAMQAYFTDPNVGFGPDALEIGAQAAYRMADAVLKAQGGGAA